jgi:hypothetical protein
MTSTKKHTICYFRRLPRGWRERGAFNLRCRHRDLQVTCLVLRPKRGPVHIDFALVRCHAEISEEVLSKRCIDVNGSRRTVNYHVIGFTPHYSYDRSLAHKMYSARKDAFLLARAQSHRIWPHDTCITFITLKIYFRNVHPAK